MARFVSVYRDGKFHTFFKLKHALKRIASGRFRWRNEANFEVEEVPFEARPCKHIFHDPPKTAQFMWKPRPSGITRIRILQATWRTQAK